MKIPNNLQNRPAILLFRGKGLMSALIRWQTRSKYSHAALLTREGTVIEAWQFAGVREIELKSWEGVDAFDVEGLFNKDWDNVIDFARSKIGCKYDWLAIARFISRRSGIRNDRWFCSELVFAAFLRSGIRLLARIPMWKVHPGMLSYPPVLTKIPTNSSF